MEINHNETFTFSLNEIGDANKSVMFTDVTKSNQCIVVDNSDKNDNNHNNNNDNNNNFYGGLASIHGERGVPGQHQAPPPGFGLQVQCGGHRQCEEAHI